MKLDMLIGSNLLIFSLTISNNHRDSPCLRSSVCKHR